MTKTENIEKIRKACIAMNHEIVTSQCDSCRRLNNGFVRPIRLADVLLLFVGVSPNSYDKLFENKIALMIVNSWELTKDNLEEQSKKTILLLTSLLPE